MFVLRTTVKIMEWTIIILIFGLFITTISQDLRDENKKQNFPIATVIDKNKTDNPPKVMVGVSSGTKSQLSDKTLADLFSVSKNISHSKGIYRKVKESEESNEEYEVRRSIKRKSVITSSSDVVESILEKILTYKDKLTLLDHIEYLVHQFDVAVNFANLGGIQIISSLLFSSDDDIVSSAALVLGAAMQSNPTVQKLALQQNLNFNLLKLLSHDSSTVLSRTIFALSSFLRNYPEGQEEFISAKGVSKLAKILKNQKVTINIKIKIINLFSDLVVEYHSLQQNHNDQKIQKVKNLLESEIQNHSICKFVFPYLDNDDLNIHEKVIVAMTSLCYICLSDFQNDKVIERIKYLMNVYDPNKDNTVSLNSDVDLEIKNILYRELKILSKKIIDSYLDITFEKNEL